MTLNFQGVADFNVAHESHPKVTAAAHSVLALCRVGGLWWVTVAARQVQDVGSRAV